MASAVLAALLSMAVAMLTFAVLADASVGEWMTIYPRC